MVVRSTSFPGNVFLLTLIVAQSVGELIVRLHPPEDDGLTRNLTCVSESDDAALIWNSQRGSFTGKFKVLTIIISMATNFVANEPDYRVVKLDAT